MYRTDARTAEALGVGEFGIETVMIVGAGVAVVELALFDFAVGVGGGITERTLADGDTVAIFLTSTGDALALSMKALRVALLTLLVVLALAAELAR